MVQLLVPTSDISTGSWSTNALDTWYTQLDEPVASHDEDVTRCVSSTAGDFLIVGISAGTDPGVNTGHVLRIVARTVAVPVNNEIVQFFVRQGTTPIDGAEFALSSSYAVYTLAMSAALAANISNYVDLNFTINFVNNPAANTLRITAAELEIPDPVTAKGPIFQRHPSQRALLRR